MALVFISFEKSNRDYAGLVDNIIKNRTDHDTWICDTDIPTGKEWKDAIDDAIEKCAAMVVVVTPAADSSKYVTYEWAFAMGKEKPVLPLLFEGVDDLHDKLRDIQYLDFTDSTRPWEDFVEVLEENISQYYIPAHILNAAKALDSHRRSERQEGLEHLLSVDHPTAYNALIEALGHHMADVREATAEELGNRRDDAYVPVLIELLKDENNHVRQTTATALGSIGNRDAVPALIEALVDKDAVVRLTVASVLGHIGDSTAVAALVKILKDEEARVRHRVADALGRIGDSAAVPALIEALKDDNWDVQIAAAEALGRIRDSRAISALEDIQNKAGHHEVQQAARKAIELIKK
ncbi:MAG: HEAT repeat domain-containing protein [Anaerolineae bacterium]|nr:HEAT repeat domain-containing protein [Anaerolineae bacterium]